MSRTRLWVWLAALVLVGCTAAPPQPSGPDTAFPYSDRLAQLLPADVLILGEQHDVAHHQRIHLAVVQQLAKNQRLGALALEMASAGRSTELLTAQASETGVQTALQWQNDAWPWTAYGPAVMAAVRAGVVVAGANLPDNRLRNSMKDAALDDLLLGPALKAQQQAIRIGHCGLLPESQIGPMTRVQIARDISMGKTVVSLVKADKTVLLLTGNGHADPTLGVPLHLPLTLVTKTVLLQAQHAPAAPNSIASFSQTWATEAAPLVDYCADFEASRTPPTTPVAPAL
jgi:uncharacterized iron-regulated protein